MSAGQTPVMAESEPIYHLALARDWELATTAGEYLMSTRGVGLDEVGFIHAAHRHQVQGVADRYYAGTDEKLVLLTVDPGRLDVPVVEEVPGSADEAFPHIYGPLPVGAVISVSAVGRDADGHPTVLAD